MKGFGVLSSKKMGMFIATLEPRRLRMLAVRVLRSSSSAPALPSCEREKRYARESDVRVRHFVWEKEAACDLTTWRIVRIGEDAGSSEAREGGEGERDFVVVHAGLGEPASARRTSLASGRVGDSGGTCRNFMLPSTLRRSSRVAPYGAPGVLSSMYRPYSGWKTGMQTLRKSNAHQCSVHQA